MSSKRKVAILGATLTPNNCPFSNVEKFAIPMERCFGNGEICNVASTTTASVPSEPTISFAN